MVLSMIKSMQQFQTDGVCEEVIYSCETILWEEGKRRRALGNLENMPIYSIPYPKIKKIAKFKDHIYGL